MASVVFPKFAILSLYIRLFPYRTVRRLTWVTAALVFAYWIGGIVVWVLMCQPFAYRYGFLSFSHKQGSSIYGHLLTVYTFFQLE